MKNTRVFVVGVGIVSPAGWGLETTASALTSARPALGPLTIFDFPEGKRPTVGEVHDLKPDDRRLPRTHLLALAATRQVMAGEQASPDAVILGVTTGGMPTTEVLMRQGEDRRELYRWHGLGTVADLIADETGCAGPVLTVSTACSSGAVAMKLALELLRTGEAKRVLAGGVDGLCRLTVHGFSLLQLVDPKGCRPFDTQRRGMTVAEGAGLFMLSACPSPPSNALAELMGGGLSCDAYHPTAPHPSGDGAARAMRAALSDAGIGASQIDYVNLHGTGTRDNDVSEARGVRAVFSECLPPHSSTKGIFGHSLAAAGAVEAAVATVCVRDGLVPANAGLEEADPELGLDPQRKSAAAPIGTVMSNSLGFGGNNAALVIGRPSADRQGCPLKRRREFVVSGCGCLTGAGGTEDSLRRFAAGKPCLGRLSDSDVAKGLEPRVIRRLRRLPRVALALARAAVQAASPSESPGSIFWATGWGPLSETHEFLRRLFESGGRFSSPTDFAGAVHNAPAGQLAMRYKAEGINITTTGGNHSFEQALLAASLLEDDSPALIVGADEAHPVLSPLVDPSASPMEGMSDGGGAMLVKPAAGRGSRISLVFFAAARSGPEVIEALADSLGGGLRIRHAFGAVFAGLPADTRDRAGAQLAAFLARTGFQGPVVEYRRLLGQFATVAAAASVMAVKLVESGVIPEPLTGGPAVGLGERSVLLLGLGDHVSAVEVHGPQAGRWASQ